jgi:hypothetical protein
VKKVLALVVFFFISCTLFSPISVMASEGQLGVFFGTRDLEGLKWLKKVPSDASVESYGNNFIVVDSEDSFWHIPFRHCFLLLGRQLTAMDDKLLIEVIAARGFSRIIKDGKLTKKTEDGDETEWLLDLEKRSKLTVSCMPFVLEGMPLAKRDGSTVLATEENVQEIWDRCYTAFRNRIKTKNEYHGFKNNCCSSAFESLRQVTEESRDFDLSPNLRYINIRDYNFFGAGISLYNATDFLLGLCDNPCVAYDKYSDACDIQKGSVRFFFDITVSNVLKLGIHKVNDIRQLEKYRKGLRETEERAIESTFQRYKKYGMTKDEARQIIRRIDAKQFFAKESKRHRSKVGTIVKSVFIDVTVGTVGFSVWWLVKELIKWNTMPIMINL